MCEMVINCVNGRYTLRNERGDDVLTLSVGQHFEVMIRGQWCQVRLESGGYNGCYYVTADGECGRLALCMQARMCQQVPGEQAAWTKLEQARAFWIGKHVESRVPLACGMVRGVVRDITQGGFVVFVYTPRLNEVPVVVSFPLERIGDVLVMGFAAARATN
jgi:hypothetical protein